MTTPQQAWAIAAAHLALDPLTADRRVGGLYEDETHYLVSISYPGDIPRLGEPIVLVRKADGAIEEWCSAEGGRFADMTPVTG